MKLLDISKSISILPTIVIDNIIINLSNLIDDFSIIGK